MLPKPTPLTVALAVVCPAGIVIVGVATVTTLVSLLDNVTSNPPAGAAGLMVIGSDALSPISTVTGPPTVMAFGATSMFSVPCAYPVADARNVVLPEATPLTVPVACVCAEGTVTVAVTTPSTEALSDVNVTLSPPAGASVDNVTRTSAVWPTPTTPVFTSASDRVPLLVPVIVTIDGTLSTLVSLQTSCST